MLAFWLVGCEEESPEASGELCVAELFGNAIGRERSSVRIGVKAHHDSRLAWDVEDVILPLDAADRHTYGVEWTDERIRFFVDDHPVRTGAQGIDCPLQLTVDLFEFPEGPERDPAGYPKTGDVGAVRGYRPAG